METDNNGTNVYWAYGDSEEPSAEANESYGEAKDYWRIHMKEFIMAALPWVVISLCIVVLAVRTGRKESKKKETYIGEGMCIGMCLGVSLKSMIGFDNLGTAMCIGMLIGENLKVLLLTNGDELISFCAYTEKDDETNNVVRGGSGLALL